jgi:hypothetical protein
MKPFKSIAACTFYESKHTKFAWADPKVIILKHVMSIEGYANNFKFKGIY